jgi:uncharacterized protein
MAAMGGEQMAFGFVTLLMGKKCNLACPMCSQADDRGQVEEDLPLGAAALDFLKRNARAPGGLTLLFWGGEPLCYFGRIKETVEALSGEPVKFALTTNGLLLDAEMVRFFNWHGFDVMLSCDGPGTVFSKGANALEDGRVLSLFKSISRRGIALTVHALSQDLFAAWDWIENRAGKDARISCGNFIRANAHTPERLVDFDSAAFAMTYERLIRAANGSLLAKANSRPLTFMRKLVRRLIGSARRKDARTLPCGQLDGRVSIDFAGNVYPCHNAGGKFGHVADGEGKLSAAYFALGHNPCKWKACTSCPVHSLCLGYCPFVEPSAKKERVCEILRVLYCERLFEFLPMKKYREIEEMLFPASETAGFELPAFDVNEVGFNNEL